MVATKLFAGFQNAARAASPRHNSPPRPQRAERGGCYILHETRTRLRLRLAPSTHDLKAFEDRLCAVDGVSSVRTNAAVCCAVVWSMAAPRSPRQPLRPPTGA